MKTRTTLLALTLTALAGSALAQQGIYVEDYHPQHPGDGWAAMNGFPDRSLQEPGLPSGSDISLTITNSRTIRIYAENPTTTDIGVITLKTAEGQSPTLLIGRTSSTQANANAPLTTPACRTLAGVRANALVKVQIRAGSISGPGIDTHHLVRLDLSGDLDAPIVQWGDRAPSAPRIGAIDVAGDVTPNASVAAHRGNIGPVTIAGDLNGSISTKTGTIDFIETGGSIGALGRPAIGASAPQGTFAIDRVISQGSMGRSDAFVDIVASGAVRELVADDMHAFIDLESEPSRPGFLAHLKARTGDFAGSLRARTLTSFGGWDMAPCKVMVAGDVRGDLIFTNGIRNEHAAGPEIDIHGAIHEDSAIIAGSMFQFFTALPPAEIRVRQDGALAGTIVVGTGSPSDIPSQATIRVGSQNPLQVTGADPFYSASFESLGGGSVAIAPFNFHQTESFPDHNETITLESNEILTAIAPRLFGPVFVVDQNDQHMIVEHLPDGASTWIDRSSEFELEAPTDPALGSRTIVLSAIAPAHFDAGQWRIRPVEDTIFCSLARGTPSVRFDSEYADDTYRFLVAGGSDCPQPRTGRTTRNDIDFDDADGVIRVTCP